MLARNPVDRKARERKMPLLVHEARFSWNIASLSVRLIILGLFIVNLTRFAGAGTIYLVDSGIGAVPWSGECDDIPVTCRTTSTDCYADVTVNINGTEPCRVVVLSVGGPPFPRLAILAPTTLDISVVPNLLPLSFTVEDELTLTAAGTSQTAFRGAVDVTLKNSPKSQLKILDSFIASSAQFNIFAEDSVPVRVTVSGCRYQRASSPPTISAPFIFAPPISLPGKNDLHIIFTNSTFGSPVLLGSENRWYLVNSTLKTGLTTIELNHFEMFDSSQFFATSLASISSNSSTSLLITNQTNFTASFLVSMLDAPDSASVEIKVSEESRLANLALSAWPPLLSTGRPSHLIISSGSVITGFTINYANVTMSEGETWITNCPLFIDSSFNVLSSTAHIELDSHQFPHPPTGASVILTSNMLTVGPGSSLIFSSSSSSYPSSYLFNSPSPTVIGSPDGDCSFFPGSGFDVIASPRREIQTYCRTILCERVNSSLDFVTISAAGPSASLYFDSRVTYDATFDTGSFSLIEINPSFSYASDEFSIRTRTENALITQGKPGRIRIDWNQTMGEPEFGIRTKIFNFTASSSYNLVENSYTIPSDLYEFEIIYLRVDDTLTSVFFERRESPPPSVPIACPTPPPGFICRPDGKWQEGGSSTVPGQIVLPPRGVQVFGNFTVDSLVFSGVDSSLNVSECITLASGSTITLDFSNGQKLKSGVYTLITQNGYHCQTSLKDLFLSLKQPKHGCERVESKIHRSSTRSTLNVAFTIDSAKCYAKWIIIGSVIGVVVIIAVISISLVGYFLNSAKWKRSASQLEAANKKSAPSP